MKVRIIPNPTILALSVLEIWYFFSTLFVMCLFHIELFGKYLILHFCFFYLISYHKYFPCCCTFFTILNVRIGEF